MSIEKIALTFSFSWIYPLRDSFLFWPKNKVWVLYKNFWRVEIYGFTNSRLPFQKLSNYCHCSSSKIVVTTCGGWCVQNYFANSLLSWLFQALMLNFKRWKVNFPPHVVEKRELQLFEFLYFCILSAALALLRLRACFDIIIALWVHYGNPWHVEDVSQLGIWKCQVNNKIYNFQGTLGKNIISSQGSRER